MDALPPGHDLCALDGHLGGEFALFGLSGLVLVSFHCVGMCGPLMLVFCFGETAQTPFARARSAATQLLCYQSGRLLVYLVLGVLVGLIGSALHQQLLGFAKVLTIITAIAFFLYALIRLRVIPLKISDAHPTWLSNGMRFVLANHRKNPHQRAFMLGLVMAFLPCVLVFWALGLAASRGHPLDGGLLMVGLVVLTTPVLFFAAAAPALWGKIHRLLQDRVAPWAMLFSACWLGLIALAANGVIAHQAIHLGTIRIVFW